MKSDNKKPDYLKPELLELAGMKESEAACSPGSSASPDCISGGTAANICNAGNNAFYCTSGAGV